MSRGFRNGRHERYQPKHRAQQRTVAWSKARKGLLGETLPIEVIRMRVRRATELGLPYRSYASIRASTGRDVLGFLFSSNALRLIRAGDALPAPYADRLARRGLIAQDARPPPLPGGADKARRWMPCLRTQNCRAILLC